MLTDGRSNDDAESRMLARRPMTANTALSVARSATTVRYDAFTRAWDDLGLSNNNNVTYVAQICTNCRRAAACLHQTEMFSDCSDRWPADMSADRRLRGKPFQTA